MSTLTKYEDAFTNCTNLTDYANLPMGWRNGNTKIPVYKKFSNLMQKSVAKVKKVLYNKQDKGVGHGKEGITMPIFG